MANATIPGGGGGKIKSVGLTMPGEFSVANSPLTASGTLAVTKVNQNANLVYAGPTSGIAAQPTFRSIVAADLPAGIGTVTSVGLSTNAAWLTVGSSPITTSGTITLNSTTGLTANQVLATPNGGTGVVGLRSLVAADIPSLPASQITTGQLALARGGTNADLSATGAANSFLKQSSSGAAITVGTIASADLTTALTTPPAIGGTTPAAVTTTFLDAPAGTLASLTNYAIRTLATIDTTATSGSGSVSAVFIDITGSGANSTVSPRSLNINLNAGYTGSRFNAAVGITNTTAGTSAFASASNSGNIGAIITSSAVTAGDNIGLYNIAASSTSKNIGSYNRATAATTGSNFGVIASATGGTIANVGVYAALSLNVANMGANSAALIADNGSTAAAIMIGRDNGTVVFSIADGGVATFTPLDTATAATTNALVVDHSTSGTPAAGYGTGVLIRGQSSTTASQSMTDIQASWVVATHASRTARVIHNVYDTAAREVLRFEASGSAAMIGVLGAAASLRQTSGANLTNNVTSGGTDDTIANYTDLIIYANDAAAIRNDIYQLARKLKQLNDGLRLFGWFT